MLSLETNGVQQQKTNFCCNARVQFRCKQHESLNPSCLVAIVDAGVGGVMVWGIFLACFGHLPTEYHLYITTYLRIAHLHVFMIKEGVQCIVESMPQRKSSEGKKGPAQYLHGVPFKVFNEYILLHYPY